MEVGVNARINKKVYDKYNSKRVRELIGKGEATKKMSYEEFKQIVEEELRKTPDGLTWTQIRKRRPEIYQKFPANRWVRRMEKDIRLIRSRKAGKTIWRLE